MFAAACVDMRCAGCAFDLLGLGRSLAPRSRPSSRPLGLTGPRALDGAAAAGLADVALPAAAVRAGAASAARVGLAGAAGAGLLGLAGAAFGAGCGCGLGC